jgi:hypothetical protein
MDQVEQEYMVVLYLLVIMMVVVVVVVAADTTEVRAVPVPQLGITEDVVVVEEVVGHQEWVLSS